MNAGALARLWGAMKIYTKQGDAGWTRLANGEKTRKSDVRVDLYGTADELNSHIGLALSQPGVPEETRAQLLDLQHLLFELGSELAGYYKNKEGSIIREEDTGKLEQWMDQCTAVLPPLRAFILPGGEAAASALHICRTVCRRLERAMTAALDENSGERPVVYPEAYKFINRLSDYLFIAARYVNFRAGKSDIEWQTRETK